MAVYFYQWCTCNRQIIAFRAVDDSVAWNRNDGLCSHCDCIRMAGDGVCDGYHDCCVNRHFCWVGIPYTMLQVTGVLQNVPAELYEAAKIDGANAFQIFFKIKLPLCMPYITLCLFWTISQAFKMFDLNYSLTKGGPYGSTVSLALNIYNDAFANNKYGLATAESFVFFVIILVITSVQMYFSRKKEEELM